MAKNAAPPGKPNFLSTIMFAVAAFLLFNMWMNPQKGKYTLHGTTHEVTSADEALRLLRVIDGSEPKSVRDANANLADANDVLLPAYSHFISEEVEQKKRTKKEAEDLALKATILTGHIQLKNGVAANDTNRIRFAYNSLEKYERRQSTDPVWSTEPIQVLEKGQTVDVTGHALFENLTDTLSARNKTDYIWGFIPGGYQFIDALVSLTGKNPAFSYAFATLLLAFLVRAVVFPLSQKQLMTSRQMSQLMPRLKEIKENFKDDPTEMNRRSMELYARYGINPFSGCLPAVVQMPLFLTVYQCMVHYQFEFTKGTFLWINPKTSEATHGLLARNLGQLDYPLIAIYSVTMVISTLLTPVTDPTQAKQQRMIGLVAAVAFPIMMCFGFFPVVSGFVLYWTFTNLFSMAQSLRAYRMPMPELVEVNAPGGGVFPGKPKGKWAQIMEDMQKAAEEQQRNGGARPATGGISNGKPKTRPSDEPKLGNGKVSPARPADGKGNEPKKPSNGSSNGKPDGGSGANAKNKPKKRN